jgi:hypothetical protein
MTQPVLDLFYIYVPEEEANSTSSYEFFVASATLAAAIRTARECMIEDDKVPYGGSFTIFKVPTNVTKPGVLGWHHDDGVPAVIDIECSPLPMPRS